VSIINTDRDKNHSLKVGCHNFSSRLIVGTGKYSSLSETQKCIEASGSELITIAIRRTNLGQKTNEPNILDYIPTSRYTLLPNTAGCYTAKDAVRTLVLARELLGGHKLVKLEVLGNEETLYPNVIETVIAAKTLIAEGFEVMVYTSDDPIVAKKLEDIGCSAIMPLGSLIGSGMGILNRYNLEILINTINVPVIVDAGLRTASDVSIAMEMGCDAVLVNTAIAAADNPSLMARAMKQAVVSGRNSYLAGPMSKKIYKASPSSPRDGVISS